MDSNADQGPQVFADFPAAQHTAKPQQASHQFSGLGLQDLLVVEICAGSARLTKTVRAKGMRGLAIDKTKSRGCGTEIMVLDLTLEQDLRILLQLLRSESKRIAWFLFLLHVVLQAKQESVPSKLLCCLVKNSLNPSEHQANLTKRICCQAWTRPRLNWPTNSMRQSLPSFWIAIKLG